MFWRMDTRGGRPTSHYNSWSHGSRRSTRWRSAHPQSPTGCMTWGFRTSSTDFDGHEREDIMSYLAVLQSSSPRLWTSHSPAPNPRVFHDESTFYANPSTGQMEPSRSG